jgi:hypothetical protein
MAQCWGYDDPLPEVQVLVRGGACLKEQHRGLSSYLVAFVYGWCDFLHWLITGGGTTATDLCTDKPLRDALERFEPQHSPRRAKSTRHMKGFADTSHLYIGIDAERKIVKEGMLSTRTSHIENAGLGVFANGDLKGHTFLGYYTGIFSETQPKDTSYTFITSKGYIDAQESKCTMAIVNHAPEKEANIYWREDPFHRIKIFVKGVGICSGEELCMNYGPGYYWPDNMAHFRCKRYNMV